MSLWRTFARCGREPRRPHLPSWTSGCEVAFRIPVQPVSSESGGAEPADADPAGEAVAIGGAGVLGVRLGQVTERVPGPPAVLDPAVLVDRALVVLGASSERADPDAAAVFVEGAALG